jgi:hypothetical protein
MTYVMFLVLMVSWFALGAVTMVVMAALGRAGRMQDERRAAAVRRARVLSESRSSYARAA